MGYLAFISYKHIIQTKFVEKLELDLKRYAKPFWQPPARIFRDEKYLSPGPDLPRLITNALQESRYLIYVASPEAAISPWVQSELNCWCNELNRTDNLIVVLTSGTINTKDQSNIDWDTTTALPKDLSKSLTKLPFYIDLSWILEVKDQSLDHPRYKSAVNQLVARLREIEPINLIGQEILEHRRTRFVIRLTITTLLVLTTIAIGIGIVAYKNAQRADKEAERAFETLVSGVGELTSVADIVMDNITTGRISKSDKLKILSTLEDAYWNISKSSDLGEFRRTEIGRVFQKVASVYFRLGEREKSLDAFERFIEFSRKLADKQFDNPAWRSALAAGLLRLANERGVTGDKEGRIRDLEEAVSIFKKLSENESLNSFDREGFASGIELRSISRVNFGRAVLLLDDAKRDMSTSIDVEGILAAIRALDAALEETPKNTYVRSEAPKLRAKLQGLLKTISQ